MIVSVQSVHSPHFHPPLGVYAHHVHYPHAGYHGYNQVEEVVGGVVAAEDEAHESTSEVWKHIFIGVATGMIIYVGHRLLDKLFPRGDT